MFAFALALLVSLQRLIAESAKGPIDIDHKDELSSFPLNSIDLDVFSLFVSLDSTEFDMQLVDSKISLLPGKIVCNNLNGHIDSLGLSGQFFYSWLDKDEMKMDLFNIDKLNVELSFLEPVTSLIVL